jgi:hypothetical protein
MIRRSIITGLSALAFFASQASAQRYTLKKPPEYLDEFSVGVTMMSPCDMKISNLGNIANVFDQAGKYDDASVAADNTATTLNDGKTYNFSYTSMVQLTDKNGNPSFEGQYLKATAVNATATNGTFSENGDSGFTRGIEAAYTHYFDRRHKLGIVFALCNNGFSMKKSADWDVTLTTRSDLYEAENLAGMDGFSGGSADRPRVFSTDVPEVYIYYKNPISLGETALNTDDPISATGAWDLKTAYISLRMGPVYNFTLSRHWLLRTSGGLAIVSASSRFRWDETYTAPLESGDVDIEASGTNTKHKMLLGGWGDVGAHYRVNRAMTLYTTLEYQGTTSMEQDTAVGHHIELDSSSIYSLKTGFTWAF